MKNKIIDIIIPTYNGLENLKIVFPSIYEQRYKDFRIILVDNASTDKSIEYIEQNYPKTVVIKNKVNEGFAAGVNKGIRYSLDKPDSDYILLLNNDIELENDFLETGIKSFSISNDIGSIAVKMKNFYKRDYIDDTGDFIKANGGSPLARGMGEKDEGQYDRDEYVFSACAGAGFYKKDALKITGLMDEDFFAYLEDVDLGFRLQLAGYKCYYNHKIICYHKRGATALKVTGFVVYQSEKNLISLRLKNYPATIYILYTPLFLIARVWRFYKFLFFYEKGIFSAAIKGYYKGLLMVPSALKKRKDIMKTRKVDSVYIRSTFK